MVEIFIGDSTTIYSNMI